MLESKAASVLCPRQGDSRYRYWPRPTSVGGGARPILVTAVLQPCDYALDEGCTWYLPRCTLVRVSTAIGWFGPICEADVLSNGAKNCAQAVQAVCSVAGGFPMPRRLAIRPSDQRSPTGRRGQ